MSSFPALLPSFLFLPVSQVYIHIFVFCGGGVIIDLCIISVGVELSSMTLINCRGGSSVVVGRFGVLLIPPNNATKHIPYSCTEGQILFPGTVWRNDKPSNFLNQV